MRKLILATGLLVLAPTLAFAQTPREKSQLESQCAQRPGSAACEQLKREVPPTTTGTFPGPGNPNRPGTGVSGSSEGTSGAGAGSISPEGNPSNAGGSPQSGQ